MNQIAIHEFAHKLLQEFGVKAMHVAARRAVESEEKGDNDQASTWRRVERAISQMRGPAES